MSQQIDVIKYTDLLVSNHSKFFFFLVWTLVLFSWTQHRYTSQGELKKESHKIFFKSMAVFNTHLLLPSGKDYRIVLSVAN